MRLTASLQIHGVTAFCSVSFIATEAFFAYRIYFFLEAIAAADIFVSQVAMRASNVFSSF
jgi:hypothetical protein